MSYSKKMRAELEDLDISPHAEILDIVEDADAAVETARESGYACGWADKACGQKYGSALRGFRERAEENM